MPKRFTTICAIAGISGVFATCAAAQADETRHLNTFGMPGIVTLPSALPLDDAELASSVTVEDGLRKYTVAFQITPRLTAAFRYSIVENFAGRTTTLFDRSFDAQYQLLREGDMRPAVTIGLRDFIGTGIYTGEYLVASKQITPQITGTAGIGWGTFATRDGFRNPLTSLNDRFDTRVRDTGQGGRLTATQWFRGDAALFAGATWQVDDKLALALEYSSDASDLSSRSRVVMDASALNLGVSYALQPDILLGAQYLRGDTFGLSAHFTLNPRHPPAGGDTSPAPAPFALRDGTPQPWAGPVMQDAIPQEARLPALQAGLAAEGITLHAFALSDDTAHLRIRNDRYDIATQAIGRTARMLSVIMPARITQFDIVLMQNGVPVSQTRLQRADLERLEYQPGFIAESLDLAQIGVPDTPAGLTLLAQDRLTWGIGPYVGLSLFDPDDPLRADLGIEASANYAFTPDLSLTGVLRAKVVGNRDASTRASDSVLPHVRSDQALYDRDGELGVERLTLDRFGRIGDAVYTRTSLGYLEEMFAGASAEVLWKPVDSRFALGIDLNAVMQRDTDKLFGFDDFDYQIATGHVSGYYAFENGVDLQLDVGRYLAGDWGTTISIDRRFGNGWAVGAFATFTDVPFDDFGEGSFDKGIRVSVPLSWALGKPSRTDADFTLRSLQRDGGARLQVDNRLYPTVRDAHGPELRNQWGRFWR